MGLICTQYFDYHFQVQIFMSCSSLSFRRTRVTCPVFPAVQRPSSAHQQCCLKGRLSRNQSIPSMMRIIWELVHTTHCPIDLRKSMWPHRHIAHGCRCRDKSPEIVVLLCIGLAHSIQQSVKCRC